MKKWAKYLSLALMIIKFLREVEPLIDKDEKTKVDDLVLEILDEVASKLAGQSPPE